MAAKFFMACLLVARLTLLADAASSSELRGSDPQNSGTGNQAHSSQAGPSPTPAEVEGSIMAKMQISDPLQFDLDRYVETVKKATGVSQPPKAVVKAFNILVNYVLPDAMSFSEAKAAIAKANNVLDSQVQVTHFDQWFSGKPLALNIVLVNITVLDKSKAAAVKTSAADMAALESEIDGHVSVSFAPVMDAIVETKVKTASSAISQLWSLEGTWRFKDDGIIKVHLAWWHFKDDVATPARASASGASSNVSIVLAVLLILLRAT